MAKKPIPPKALTRKATPAAKSAQAAAPKKTVAKSAPKPVTKPAAAKKPVSQQVARKASVKPVQKVAAKSVAAKPAARKCGTKMASPGCAKKAAAKPVVKIAAVGKNTVKPTAKTAKPVVKAASKPAVKSAAKPVAKLAAKPAKKPVAKVAAKPVAKPVASKAKAVKAAPAKVETKKAVKKVVPVAPAPKKVVVAKPAPKSNGAVLKKPAPPAVNSKTVKGTPAGVRKMSEVDLTREVRRAFGSYDGILVCETPGYFPEKTPYTEKELAALHKLLLERRRHLLEVLRELDEKTFSNSLDSGKAYNSTANTHLFEGASDNMASDMALMVRQEEEQALTQVEAALDRLEDGLFGVCVACGDKIGIPRLKAKPEAHLCISCKTVYDKKSRLR
jgi:RNA polymerase-binding protein DksA